MPLSIGCSDSKELSASKTVFDQDNRQILPIDRYPFSAIGLVSFRNKQICTGTLVSEALVLTSAHCLASGEINHPQDVTFHIGFRNNKQKAASRVVDIIVGTQFPLKNRARDWAILKLSLPLGKQYGYIPVLNPDTETFRSFLVSLAGYSLDFFQKYRAPSLHRNCSVKYSYNYLLRHDCDSETGASGGPLLVYDGYRSYYLAGIHVTSAKCPTDGALGRCKLGTPYSHDYANYGVSAGSFYKILQDLRMGHAKNYLRWAGSN